MSQPSGTGSAANSRNQPSPPTFLQPRPFAAIGALLVGVGVALGALGAHTLADVLTPSRLQTFETAARYQVYSGLGIMLLALLAVQGKRVVGAALAVLIGCLVFCGSLYLLVAGAPSFFGAVAPVGGALMIGGWLVAAWRLWFS